MNSKTKNKLKTLRIALENICSGWAYLLHYFCQTKFDRGGHCQSCNLKCAFDE